MAHAVSALYSKFNRMSPTAAALALLLHALVALALLWDPPLKSVEAAEEAIEFTVQEFIPPPGEPQTPAAPTPEPTPTAPAAQPPTVQAPAPTPSAQPNTASRLGLPPPRSLTPDPRAIPAPTQPDPKPAETKPPETATTEPTKPEPAKPEPAKPEPAKSEPAKVEAAKPETAQPKPEQQQAAAAPPPPPPPPPEPKLEQVLPAVEAPPPPITAQDFPKPAPPPSPPKPPQPQAPPQPPPPPPPQRAQTPSPQQQLQPSPLGRAPQQRPPANSQAAAQPAPSPLTNPASQYGQRKAQDDYLWQVMRKMSQYHYTPKSGVVSEEGVVVMRITIARDGRLLDVSLAKSSGFPTLDNGVMDTIRRASPFAPLPAEIPGAQHTFILPVNYAYRGVR